MCDYTCVTNRRELSVPVLAFPSKLSEWKGNTNVSCSRAHDLSLTTRSLVSLLFCPISLSLYLLCSEQLLEFLSETGSQKKQRYFHQKYIGVISRKVLWHWACTTSLSLSLFPSRRLVVERHTALWAHALAEDVHCWDVLFLWWEFIVTGVVGGLLVVSLWLSLWALLALGAVWVFLLVDHMVPQLSASAVRH